MPKKFLVVFIVVLFTSACTSLPFSSSSTPTAIPIPSIMPSPKPSATAMPTIAIETLLAQQATSDLSAFPRPECQVGKQNSPEWTNYNQGLAATLGKLVSDPRAQSLSLSAVTGIFGKASGLVLDVVETNNTSFVILVNANCVQRLGGGSSPNSPRDTAYVLSRRGGMWQIGQVANVLKAIWVEDHWNVLVTQTQWGNAQDFEMWLVRATNGEWKKETKLKFTQLYGDPLPKLSADGLTVTLYAYAASCNITKNPNASPLPTIESDYKFQNGEFKCATSRIVPTPTPTKKP